MLRSHQINRVNQESKIIPCAAIHIPSGRAIHYAIVDPLVARLPQPLTGYVPGDSNTVSTDAPVPTSTPLTAHLDKPGCEQEQTKKERWGRGGKCSTSNEHAITLFKAGGRDKNHATLSMSI